MRALVVAGGLVAALAHGAAAQGTAPASEAAPPPPSSLFAWPAPRLALELDLVTQARYTRSPAASGSELRLDRGELGARVGLGADAAAQLTLEAIRSASDGGSLGIDGNSTVVRVKYASVAGRVELGGVVIEGALGFVPDPWITTLEGSYPLKPLSRTASERMLGWPVSDLAALAGASIGPVRLRASVGNGEGQRYPERNDGKTTTAVAEVVVVDTTDVRASVAALGRDGSVGVARVRDRRLGGVATVVSPWIRGGASGVKAWGIGDRGEAEGVLVEAWTDARVVDPLHVAARFSTLGYAGGGRATTFGGALSVEPWAEAAAHLRLWLAVERVTTSGAAMPIAGADAGDATVVLLIASATAPFVVD